MKKVKNILIAICFIVCFVINAQDDKTEGDSDYIEFNDRTNVVHGVYLGMSIHYGEIKSKNAYMTGFKLAYVANQQFEVGFEGNFMYSEQDVFNTELARTEDIFGAYIGLHLEPIFFSKSRVNLSFPLLIGVGGIGYIDSNTKEEDLTGDDFDGFFVAEPGMNLLFNISRYLQIEAGIKYRLTSKVNLVPNTIDNLNGFSAGIGIKVGVFNLGKNRYKQKI